VFLSTHELWGVLSDGVRIEPVHSEPGAYQRVYVELAAMLRDGAAASVAPEDALAGLGIIEAAQRSAAERRVVQLA
jgi:scyllo-inositol 2-dehydrogenase (NADP+)